MHGIRCLCVDQLETNIESGVVFSDARSRTNSKIRANIGHHQSLELGHTDNDCSPAEARTSSRLTSFFTLLRMLRPSQPISAQHRLTL